VQIEWLEIFCDLAELQSFLKTAQKHGISQSAVSQQLAKLEASYGCKLLERKQRPIALTSQGKLVYRAAKDISKRSKKLKYELDHLRTADRDRIKVGAILSAGLYTLPRHMKDFMLISQNIQVDVEYAQAEKIYEALAAGDLDVGIVVSGKRDNRMLTHEFEDEEMVLVTSVGKGQLWDEEVDIRGKYIERFIAFSEGSITKQLVDNFLARCSAKTNILADYNNIETIKRAVEARAGTTILPLNTVLGEIKTGKLKAAHFSNERFFRPTEVIVSRSKEPNAAVQNFVNELCAHII
jgi:DNA-binding transcriptional LysR family regulator